jgi:catechol 2,3-dioxygenase-like lactoylglutathione lyase family enzyme
MKPKFDMIGIVTKDMKASLEFYRRLGWETPTDQDQEAHVEITLENGLRFAWDTLELMQRLVPDHVHHPHSVGAFLLENAAAVDAKYFELTQAGYASTREPWDAFWGQRYAMIQDPDGNTVDLFAPLEG